MWTSTVTIVAPEAEPVLLAAAKEYLRVDEDDTNFDGQIAGFIAAARADLEAVSGTRLIAQTVRMRGDNFCDLQQLPVGPIQAITSIQYLDTAGAEQTLDAGGYELFGEGLERGIRPVLGGSWPAVRAAKGAVAVTAIAGYGAAGADLPQNLYFGLLRIVRGMMDEKPVDVAAIVVNDRIWL